VIKISPEHILFWEKCYLSHDNYLDNSVLVFDDSILFQGSKYPDSLTSEIANYKSWEWWISLLFKNENKGTALDVKHFLEAYRDQYIEEHSENEYNGMRA
jgi:hypothetical protein